MKIDTLRDQCKIRKKAEILTERRESGIAFEKQDFLPESGNVDIDEIYLPGLHISLFNGCPSRPESSPLEMSEYDRDLSPTHIIP